MKEIYKSYRFRIYPNKEQQAVLARYFGSVRFVYNHFLAERKRQYEKTNYFAAVIKSAFSSLVLDRCEKGSFKL